VQHAARVVTPEERGSSRAYHFAPRIRAFASDHAVRDSAFVLASRESSSSLELLVELDGPLAVLAKVVELAGLAGDGVLLALTTVSVSRVA
jgi:hypothetical protein